MKRFLTLLAVTALTGCNRTEDITTTSGSTVDVKQGAKFSITLSTSPTVSPEYQYSWHPPQVSGGAVVYEGPGESKKRDKMPGSSGEQVFVFKAAQAGESEILIRVNAGPKAERADNYTLRVRVK